jgi:pSer/pThr/pTyr-binding forkhead associated (FHA) protein
VTLGRDAETADVVIEHESVAPLHARIKRSGDAYWLYDEGSANGTYVDFERLGLGPRMLYDQDRIRLGRARFVFRLQPEDEAPGAAEGEEGER